MDGIFQTAGATAAIVSLAMPESVLVREDIVITPIPTKGGMAMGFSGSF